MPEQPTRRPKRSQRLKGDPLADLDQLIADAAAKPAEAAVEPAEAPPAGEEHAPEILETEPAPPAEVEEAAVCPYLGTQEDPSEHLLEAGPAHRCYRTGEPLEIFRAHQEIYCLTSAYTSCEMFRWVKTAEEESAAQRGKRGGGLFSRLLGRK